MSMSAGGGGGIDNSGTMSISNSTIVDNFSEVAGVVEIGGTTSISGSIVADNTPANCSLALGDGGYNLESATDCGLRRTGDQQNIDPNLASALADNGGPTQTLALLSGSPAIDKIPSASCPSTDQRGVTRPDDGESACDIGAYEFVDPVDDDLGLSNISNDITANAASPAGAVVTYTPPTATDESGEDLDAAVSCTPASGSVFPIGTTTITCTATDSDDANSPVSPSFTITVLDGDMKLSNVPADITTDATSSSGAVVSYTPPTAVDEDSPAPTVSCTPASGSTFPIGTTTVTCTASDGDTPADSASASFHVTVQDVTAPTLSLPGAITADASGPSGTVVTYLVTASDPDNAASDLTITCSPASGSVFAIGTTTVNCTTRDPADNSSSGSFNVVVTGASGQVGNLQSQVDGFGLAHGPQNSFDSQLQAVAADLSAGNTGQACSDLLGFINHVKAQSGKKLTTEQANQMLAAAAQLQAVIGC